MEIRPSPRGFIRFYLESSVPLLLYAVFTLLSRLVPFFSSWLFAWVLLASFAVAWVLRSRFATLSIGLFILYVAGAAAYELKTGGASLDDVLALGEVLRRLIEEVLPRRIAEGAVVSTLLSLAYTEAFRRSIRYVVDRGGVTISGGILRKQEVFYPYTQISNVVVERGPLARILGYGTVILVSTGGWGAESYVRGIGAGAGRDGIGVGVGYARILQEASRDPLKSLYGILEPDRVAGEIRGKLSFTYEALEKQVELLREIRDKL